MNQKREFVKLACIHEGKIDRNCYGFLFDIMEEVARENSGSSLDLDIRLEAIHGHVKYHVDGFNDMATDMENITVYQGKGIIEIMTGDITLFAIVAARIF